MTTQHLLQLLNLAIGVLLPLLVALVTQYETNATLKGVLLATFAVLTSVITQVIAALTGGTAIDWFALLTNAFGTWVVGVAAFFNIWRPTVVRDRLQRAFGKAA